MKITKMKIKQTNSTTSDYYITGNGNIKGMLVLTVPGSLSAPAVTKKWTDMPVQTQRQEQK